MPNDIIAHISRLLAELPHPTSRDTPYTQGWAAGYKAAAEAIKAEHDKQ